MDVRQIKPGVQSRQLPTIAALESGYVAVGNYQYSWASARTAVNGEYTGSPLSVNRYLSAYLYHLHRGVLSFDTSEIGDKEIARAFIRLKVLTATYVEDDWDNVYLLEGPQQIPLELSDYGLIFDKTIPVGDILTYDKIVAEDTVDIYLNAAGLTLINTAGITKFCLRTRADIESAASMQGSTYIQFYGGDDAPKLFCEV